MNMLAMGASGVIGGDFNLLPATLRAGISICLPRDGCDEISEVYVQLKRFNQYTARWNSSNRRWIKMAMKMLRMHSGGEGGGARAISDAATGRVRGVPRWIAATADS